MTINLSDARRHSWRVKAINIHDGELEAVGVVLVFDAVEVRILDETVGVVRLLRENVTIEPAPREV